MKPKYFNINNLEIPDFKINGPNLHYLFALAAAGYIKNIDYYYGSLDFKKHAKYENFDAMSDLEKPLPNQTTSAFKEMLKYLNTVEDFFVESIAGIEFSKDDAIKQWIIFVNIINVDLGFRYFRVVKYRDLNEKYILKLIKYNLQFANKIENINKFGFDVKNKKDLEEKLSIANTTGELLNGKSAGMKTFGFANWPDYTIDPRLGFFSANQKSGCMLSILFLFILTLLI